MLSVPALAQASGMRGVDGSQSRRPPATFISPVGKPYRAEPGAPYAIDDWFRAVDKGGKGYLTAADFAAEADAFFPELDIDKDGEIAPPEMTRYEQEIAPEVQVGVGMQMGGRSMPRGRPPGGMPPGGGGMGGSPGGMPDRPSPSTIKRMMNMPRGAGMFGLIAIPQPVAAADADMNRGVTLAEMKAAARRRFAMLDPNNTGRLTLADLPKTPIERMAGLKR